MAKKSTALTKWDEKLAQEAAIAAQTAAGIAGGGNFLSLKSGVLSYKGGEVPGNRMNVIVVDYVLENDWNSQPYDPENPQNPECYAFGRDARQMKPHENAANPQGDDNGMCLHCPKNQFGSADRGKGKACANRVRLALVTEGDMGDVENAEVAFLKLPPTSLKGWAGYVNQITSVIHKPPLAVVTEVSVVPDPKTQFKVLFKLVEEIKDGAALEALFAKKEGVQTELTAPYPESAPAEEAAPAPRQARGRQPVAAAKATGRGGAVRVGVGKAAKY